MPSEKNTPPGCITEYFDNLVRRTRGLAPKDYASYELADALGVHEFQIVALIRENRLNASRQQEHWVIPESAIEVLMHESEELLGYFSLTPLEISEIVGLDRDSVGPLLSGGLIKPYLRKKRRQHMRSFFYLRHLLEKEAPLLEQVQVILKKLQDKEKQVQHQHRQHEDELLSKSIATADRLDVDAGELISKTSHVGQADRRFELDAWQLGAIRKMEERCHVFVQAPTGAGKTAVVETYLQRNIDRGIRLFYAVPIKALANDKYFDFCGLYGEARVGINTGDITLNPDAPIVVGTTEIVRNILFDRPDAYDVIAFDEAQYLGDEERGSAWEEAIIMSHPDTLLTFLSGSVANAERVLDWIRTVKERDVALFDEAVRPVPLKIAFPFGDGYIEKEQWNSLRLLGRKTRREFYANSHDFFAAVEKANMHPLLAFMPRRRDCEDVFEGVDRLPPQRATEMESLIKNHEDGASLNLRLRQLIVKHGCAYHHSGLMPSEKRLVEHLAKRGELRFIAATMSLASGVNFSVRSCLIHGYRRPGRGGSMQSLAPSEVLQMWGRAGRRRLDVEGYVIPCTNIEDSDLFSSVEAYPEPIERKNFVSAVNILSILSRHNAEVLEGLYKKSFSAHVHKSQYKLFADHVMFRDAGAICAVPTYNLPPYRQGVYRGLAREELSEKFPCTTCSNLTSCTRVYESIKENSLQRMIKHLKVNGFINDDFSLTFTGRLAQKFHSEIGLLMAADIVAGRVRPDNLVHYCACANASAHIPFESGERRRAPDLARRLYPPILFPALWEHFRGRKALVFWNIGAGRVAQRWIGAGEWDRFIEKQGLIERQGDVFRMLLRAGELLRSVSYLGELAPELAEAAKVALHQIMRPPLIPDSLFKVALSKEPADR